MADSIDLVELRAFIKALTSGAGTGDTVKDKNMADIFSGYLEKVQGGGALDEFETDQYEILKQLLPEGITGGTIRGRKRYLDEALEEY